MLFQKSKEELIITIRTHNKEAGLKLDPLGNLEQSELQLRLQPCQTPLTVEPKGSDWSLIQSLDLAANLQDSQG